MGGEQAAGVLVTVKNDQLARAGLPPLTEAAMEFPGTDHPVRDKGGRCVLQHGQPLGRRDSRPHRYPGRSWPGDLGVSECAHPERCAGSGYSGCHGSGRGVSMFTKILIANRGEIAVRIMPPAGKWASGLLRCIPTRTGAHFHVRGGADEAVCLGSWREPAESYLHGRTHHGLRPSGPRAVAIHPGYGFLAENLQPLRSRCEPGRVWSSSAPFQPGHPATWGETVARRIMIKSRDVPGHPRHDGAPGESRHPGPRGRTNRLSGHHQGCRRRRGDAACGRAPTTMSHYAPASSQAQAEAENAFKDSTVLSRKVRRVWPARRGADPRRRSRQRSASLERDCSLQRRHQKTGGGVAICRLLRQAVREAMCQRRFAADQGRGYVNAGTVEFLVDRQQNFYLLEVNARIQVEHPVTEQVTGIDLIKAADPHRLGRASALQARGHPRPRPRHRMPHQRRRPPERLSSVTRGNPSVKDPGTGSGNDSGIHSGSTVPWSTTPSSPS